MVPIRSLPAHNLTAMNLFDTAILLFNAKSTQRVQPPAEAGNLSNTVMDFKTAALREAGIVHPLFDNDAGASPLELHVDILELFEKLQQNLHSRLHSSRC